MKNLKRERRKFFTLIFQLYSSENWSTFSVACMLSILPQHLLYEKKWSCKMQKCLQQNMTEGTTTISRPRTTQWASYISGVTTRVQNVKAKMAEIDVQCQMFSAWSNTAPLVYTSILEIHACSNPSHFTLSIFLKKNVKIMKKLWVLITKYIICAVF